MGNAFQKTMCISVAATMALAGCETPKKLEAVPVSPTKYAHLDCEQLNAEAQRVLARYVEVGGKIDEDFKQDQALGALAGVTEGLLWPLIVLWIPFIPASREREKEKAQREQDYRHLMGERDAILRVAAEKGCPGVAQQAGKGGTELSPPKAGGESPTIPDASK